MLSSLEQHTFVFSAIIRQESYIKTVNQRLYLLDRGESELSTSAPFNFNSVS